MKGSTALEKFNYSFSSNLEMLHFFLVAAATTCAGPVESGVDFYGGDIEPLGAGFRNASSVAACCAACSATTGCAYFSFTSESAGVEEKKQPHNCWLKSSFGSRRTDAERTSGAVSGNLPPAPTEGIPPPCANKSLATHPWCDVTKTSLQRARAAIALMTTAEKAGQLSTWTPKIVPGIPRLDWPEYSYHSEGLHGLRNSVEAGGVPSTIFPQTTAMAATGNLSMVAEMGRVMALEARAVNAAMLRIKEHPLGRGGSLFFWSPTMNLARDPRWGRFQESISEDPWLLGAYSSTFLRTFQAADTSGTPATISSCKHLVAYSLEGGDTVDDNATRHNFNAVVSAQDMSESYLPAFHQCVTKGKPGQVMCSYNELNGIPTCARSDLLNDTLRTMWKFEGFVVSDQGAVEDISEHHHYAKNAKQGAVDALNNGCDVNDGTQYSSFIAEAVQNGDVTEERLDEALAVFLAQRFRAGSFDDPSTVPWAQTPASVCNSPAFQAIALAAARESIVLLNNSAPTEALRLPWSPTLIKTVAVIGAYGNLSMYGGKSDYETSSYSTLYNGIQKRFPGAKVSFTPGYAPSSSAATSTSTTTRTSAERKLFKESALKAVTAVVAASDATVVVVGIMGTGSNPYDEHEGHDRTYIGLPPDQLAVVKAASAVARGSKKFAVVFVNGGPLSCDWCRDNVDTVVEAFDGGEFAGVALADVLTGAVSPSGVLPFSVFREGYTSVVKLTDMSMRTTTGVGRTYRFYDDSNPLGPPLWPFGYGLSYSTFDVKWTNAGERKTLCLDWNSSSSSSSAGGANETKSFAQTATVTNTGSVAAAKVVMAFLAEVTPRAILHRGIDEIDGTTSATTETTTTRKHNRAPNKSLFGMQKVFLQPGESKTLTFAAPLLPAFDDWCAFCTVATQGLRVVAPGVYRLTVGGDGSSSSSSVAGSSAIEIELTSRDAKPIAAPLHAMVL